MYDILRSLSSTKFIDTMIPRRCPTHKRAITYFLNWCWFNPIGLRPCGSHPLMNKVYSRPNRHIQILYQLPLPLPPPPSVTCHPATASLAQHIIGDRRCYAGSAPHRGHKIGREWLAANCTTETLMGGSFIPLHTANLSSQLTFKCDWWKVGLVWNLALS